MLELFENVISITLFPREGTETGRYGRTCAMRLRESITLFPREGTETPILTCYQLGCQLKIDNPISPRGDGNPPISVKAEFNCGKIDNPISPRGDGNMRGEASSMSVAR